VFCPFWKEISKVITTAFLFLLLLTNTQMPAQTPHSNLFPELLRYMEELESEEIPAGRKPALLELADYMGNRIKTGKPVRLVFICTHNSRRSHMSQLWAAALSTWLGLPGIESWSGGTEATAFNPRAVAALQRAGFQIEGSGEKNPWYEVRYGTGFTPLQAFSKRYDDPVNPRSDFCAVMTCSEADAACPIVPGAEERIALPFDDPKKADGTTEEARRYDERCRQIARELLFAFRMAANKAGTAPARR
jgi:protein-tyrosine-phosphatase